MKRKTWKRIGWVVLILTIVGNYIIYNHAYKFTHYVDSDLEKTKRPEELSFAQKINTLFLGINVPKPSNKEEPASEFQTIYLNSNEKLEAWKINVPEEKGIVILFHGYSSSKSSLLTYAKEFNNKGYSTMLVDFMGSGGSSGNTTTIGYKEGRDVKEAYEFAKRENPNSEIILFGPSMGAVAIMKAIEEYKIQPNKIIIECPFESMISTTRIRFKAMNLPSFPLAELLIFYGGIQNGYNAFDHNPVEYAKKIEVPTMLMYGAKDKRVAREEIDRIYENLSGMKKLVIFDNSAHEIYLNDDKEEWNKAVDEFLKK